MPSVKVKKPRKPARSASPRSKGARGVHPAEVALAFVVKRTPRASELLAKVLGSSPGAVELLWRWCDGAEGAAAADPQVQAVVARVQEVFGPGLRGRFSVDEAAPRPAAEVLAAGPVHGSCGSGSSHGDPCHVDHDLVSGYLKPF